eukprot:TRINITY_DN6633_c0_g2_i1.p2 TRINITY_DN6633_c0_g2~~TRINITY_DN6633_c0_g2_i1.p2  ORF type:complete len:122 (-),score=16.16 TRINITY_DN6633_c0_g2_i1:46-411(-)
MYKSSDGTDDADLADIPEGDEVSEVNTPRRSGATDCLDLVEVDGVTPREEHATDDGDRTRVGDLYLVVGLLVQPPGLAPASTAAPGLDAGEEREGLLEQLRAWSEFGLKATGDDEVLDEVV